MKQAAKMINHQKVVYKINETMREELNLNAQTLSVTPSIKFEPPIAFLIPRTPYASVFGDSSLLACGGYSISQKFWWRLDFPEKIVLQTLLHIPSQADKRFFWINCLKYVTIIINFCSRLVRHRQHEHKKIDNAYLQEVNNWSSPRKILLRTPNWFKCWH